MSVSQIREWNSLASDLILTGFRLQVAEPKSAVKADSGPVKTPTKSSLPMAKRNHQDAIAEEFPDPVTKAPANIPSEPTHILSVTPPQSEPDESP